jgi:hypothetical protein
VEVHARRTPRRARRGRATRCAAGSGLWFGRDLSDEPDKCAAVTVRRESEVARDVASEQRRARHIGAVGDGQRSAGQARRLRERPRFAGAVCEAAEIELVAGCLAADRRMERREVVEREIAGADEADFPPARD